MYTWLIWVCLGIVLVYTWFDCLESHGSNAVILIKNNVGFVVTLICGALNISQNVKIQSIYYISQNVLTQNHYAYLEFTQSLTKVYTDGKKKFTPSLHK